MNLRKFKRITKNYDIADSGIISSLNFNPPRPLKTRLYKKGDKHLSVKISYNGKKISMSVHRLVATEHIPNPQNKPLINHKDRNPENNAKSNLEWVTEQENSDHAAFKFEARDDDGNLIFIGTASQASKSIIIKGRRPVPNRIYYCSNKVGVYLKRKHLGLTWSRFNWDYKCDLLNYK